MTHSPSTGAYVVRIPRLGWTAFYYYGSPSCTPLGRTSLILFSLLYLFIAFRERERERGKGQHMNETVTLLQEE